MSKASMIFKQIRAYWAVIAVMLIIAYALLSHFFEDLAILPILGSGGVLICFVAAAYFALKTSQNSIDSTASRAWSFLGTGFILWFLAYLIEAVVWIILSSELSIPSVADLIKNAGSVAVVAALIIYPGLQEKIFGRIRTILDVSLLCNGAFILFWLMFLRPVILISLMDTITVVWLEARIAFDMVIVVLLVRLFLLTHSIHERNSFISLGAGAILLTITDLISSYQKLLGVSLDSGFLNAGWMLVGLLFALGATFFRPMEELKVSEGMRPGKFIRARYEPLLAIAMAYIVISFIIVDWSLSEELDNVAFLALILMVLLLVVRQGAIAGQSEMRQHAELVNSTSDFAFVCNARGTIQLANPALRTSIGVSADQKSPINLEEFLRTSLSMEEFFERAGRDGWNGEVDFVRKDGSIFPVSLSIKPIEDEQRRRNFFAAIAHDLSQTRRREEELRNTLDQLANKEEELRFLNRELEAKVEARTHELEEMVANLAELNEELQALDVLKSEFVALVSHELRAPLTNIRTGLEVLLQGLPDLGKKSRESLGLIMSETERLSSFVEMILDLSALEAGKFQLQIHEIPVEKVIKDVIYRFSNQTNGDRLIVDVPPSLPFVLADEQALQSILLHLIDNALKYAPEGNVLIEAIERDADVLIRVTDSGPGIPEDERERVFEMFYRLDTSDSRPVYGRGLGLNLAKRFLDLMHGGIQIRDAQGQGAIVEFWLAKS